MKILMLEPSAGEGGVGRYGHFLSQALAKQGHYVLYASGTNPAEPPIYLFWPIQHLRADQLRPPFPPTLRRAINGILQAQSLVRLSIRAVIRPVDVVHLQGAGDLPLAVWIFIKVVRWRGMRYLYTPHIVGARINAKRHGNSIRRLARTAHFILVHSRIARDRLSALEPGIAARITALSEPLGPLIVADYFVQQHERTGDDGVGRILFFGFIRPYKGLDTLLRATRILLDDGYPVQLNVVGRPVGEFDAYNALIAKLSLGEHVNLELRWVSDYEAAQYFKLSNIVVLPYRDAPEIDASGVLHLAAAARRVIVVTTVGGLGERVRDGTSGFVCRPDDPDDLARALRNALSLSATESEIITTTAHAAFGLAGAWTDLAGRLTDLYQRALRSADG